MNHTPEAFGLNSPDGREAQLLSVQIHGELLGLMLRLTVRQTWRNVSGAPMAARFAFPMGWNQQLLSLQAQRRGETLVPRKIERHSRQRCSASLGVLDTGEQLTMVWQIGQIMDLQGGSLKVQLPAALAPRAPYPLQLDIEVHDPVAQGTVSSPSHDLHRVRHSGGTTLKLRAQHALDKDLVLSVHGLRDRGFAVASPSSVDTGSCTVLVSSHTRLRQATGEQSPLRMKLLMDSSSAMPPERLGQIRTALDRLLTRVTPEDQLSFSRFGEATVHDLPRLQVCTEAYQRRVRALARLADTDLGAPRVEAALRATIDIPDEDEEAVTGVAILLVTASPLWQFEPLLRRLRGAQHTLHVLAVGHEASQSFWPDLAEASGGTCESLAPGQHAEPHLARLIDDIRAQFDVQTQLQVRGAQVLAQAERPTRLGDGSTLHLWARVQPDSTARDLTGCPELQATLQWQRDEVRATPFTMTPLPVLWDEAGDLARLCAAREALGLQDDAQRQTLLAEHRLLWPDSAHLMPFVAEVKAVVPAAPRPAPAPAHARAPATASGPRPVAPVPAVAAIAPRPATAPRPLALRQAGLPAWLEDRHSPGNPLQALVQGFNARAGDYKQFRAALSATLQPLPTRQLDALVLQLSRQAGSPGRVWALMLHWLHEEHGFTLTSAAEQLVASELSGTAVSVRKQIHQALAMAAVAPAARVAA